MGMDDQWKRTASIAMNANHAMDKNSKSGKSTLSQPCWSVAPRCRRSCINPGLCLKSHIFVAIKKLKNRRRKAHPACQARVPAGRKRARAKATKKPMVSTTCNFTLTGVGHLVDRGYIKLNNYLV